MRHTLIATMFLGSLLYFATSPAMRASAVADEAAPEAAIQAPSISPYFGYRWVESGGTGPPIKQYEVHISGVADPNENLIVALRQDVSDTILSTRFKLTSTFMKSEASGAFKARIPFQKTPGNNQNIQIIVSTGTTYQMLAAPQSIGNLSSIVRADQLIDKEVTGAYIAANQWGKDDIDTGPSIDVCGYVADSEARWFKYTDNTQAPPVDHYYVKVTGAYGTIEDCLTVSFDYETTVPNVIESTVCSVNGASQFCAIFYQGTDVSPLQGEAIIHYPTHDEFVDATAGVDNIADLEAFLAQGTYCPGMFAEN